jgi:hypothetical protein
VFERAEGAMAQPIGAMAQPIGAMAQPIEVKGSLQWSVPAGEGGEQGVALTAAAAQWP